MARLWVDAPLGGIDRMRLNVKGSSLAAGQPLAATGGRIVANRDELREAGGLRLRRRLEPQAGAVGVGGEQEDGVVQRGVGAELGGDERGVVAHDV
ncbi:hypothetical protein B1218_36245, partial [Pseudomonas ogarae]